MAHKNLNDHPFAFKLLATNHDGSLKEIAIEMPHALKTALELLDTASATAADVADAWEFVKACAAAVFQTTVDLRSMPKVRRSLQSCLAHAAQVSNIAPSTVPVGEITSRITDAHRTFFTNLLSGILAAMQHADLAEQATAFLNGLIVHCVRASILNQTQASSSSGADGNQVSQPLFRVRL